MNLSLVPFVQTLHVLLRCFECLGQLKSLLERKVPFCEQPALYPLVVDTADQTVSKHLVQNIVVFARFGKATELGNVVGN